MRTRKRLAALEAEVADLKAAVKLTLTEQVRVAPFVHFGAGGCMPPAEIKAMVDRAKRRTGGLAR